MKTLNVKLNPWTVALVTAGVVSLAATAQAEEAQQHQVLTALSSTTLSGYVDTSAIWMFGRGNTVVGRSFDGPAKQDGFNLDVINVTIEKPLDETAWSAGYRAELLFGPDANALGATSTGFSTSDFAIKEAYVDVHAPLGNGLIIKMGVWSALMGYEVLEAPNDPNFSRSYGFFMEPIIHTGIQADYKVNDIVSVDVAVADRGDGINTIDSRPAIESKKSYMAELNLTAPDSAGWLKGATAYASIMDGGISAATTTGGPGTPVRGPLANENVIDFTAGATLPTPIKALSVGAAYDYRANGLYNGSYENATAAYLIYQATDKLKFANRAEYATGSWSPLFGAAAFGVPVVVPASSGPPSNVSLFGETFTVDYALWANVITRAELRWDHSLSGQDLFGSVNAFGVGTGNERNALSLALNVIYKF